MAETEAETSKAPPLARPEKGTVRDPKRKVGDVIQSGNLWPDLPRRELEDLLGTELVLEDFSYLNGKFGKFAVLLARIPGDSTEFTTACGGEVVCRKLDELKDGNNLPVLGTITMDDRYYDLV